MRFTVEIPRVHPKSFCSLPILFCRCCLRRVQILCINSRHCLQHKKPFCNRYPTRLVSVVGHISLMFVRFLSCLVSDISPPTVLVPTAGLAAIPLVPVSQPTSQFPPFFTANIRPPFAAPLNPSAPLPISPPESPAVGPTSHPFIAGFPPSPIPEPTATLDAFTGPISSTATTMPVTSNGDIRLG